MPRCLEPGQKFPLVLESDKDKPADARPTFFFRSVSARKWRQVLTASKDTPDIFEAKLVIMREMMVGWEHMTDPESGESIEFSADRIDLVGTPGELTELYGMLCEEALLTASDKKKLESQR